MARARCSAAPVRGVQWSCVEPNVLAVLVLAQCTEVQYWDVAGRPFAPRFRERLCISHHSGLLPTAMLWSTTGTLLVLADDGTYFAKTPFVPGLRQCRCAAGSAAAVAENTSTAQVACACADGRVCLCECPTAGSKKPVCTALLYTLTRQDERLVFAPVPFARGKGLAASMVPESASCASEVAAEALTALGYCPHESNQHLLALGAACGVVFVVRVGYVLPYTT